MRFNPIPLITILLLTAIPSLAQENDPYAVSLRSGIITPIKDISPERLIRFNNASSRVGGKSFVLIQFETIPSPQQREELKQSGIELLDFIPGNVYTATVSSELNETITGRFKVRAIIEPTAVQKMQPELARGNFPAHALRSAGMIDVWISFPKSFSAETIKTELRKKSIEILDDELVAYHILSVRVRATGLGELALLPCIEYVQAIPGEDKALNYNSMFLSKAHLLKAATGLGGKNLTGQGVVVGVGDNGDLQTHIDFTNRLINRTGDIPRAHATHVAGTVGGAGILQELYAGYAPKATILGQIFSQVFTHAPEYVQDHGMVITNNSYASVVGDCSYAGVYDLSSRILDQQAFDLPELQQVFAAGNDGAMSCAPAPLGYKAITGGYQCAKNVLTVGSTNLRGFISGFSSRGPVKDGRIKPEITAQGEFLASTWFYNQYSYNNGTSMASPGVSGGLALLIEGYRNLHSGTNPKNGLMKAILCNGSLDKGAGPTFAYGFGNMNLLRSYKIMEDATYFTGSLVNGADVTHQITVPAGIEQVKVLLYWQDPPATVMASKTLVNDLDLQVTGSGGPYYPIRLDTATITGPLLPPAPDHINNIEQVIINTPAPGTYDLTVAASQVAQNPSQEYFLVYDMVPKSLVLTNPVGGENFVPTISSFLIDTVYINWDSYGEATSTFTAEFFNGTSWSTLSSNIPSNQRVYGWAVPINNPTDAARIRLTRNTDGATQTSFPFVITDMPVDSLTPTQCEGYIQLGWRPVPAATDYEVMWLQGDEMVSKAIVPAATLNYTFSGLSKDSVYWVTVRPRINGNPGRRAVAVSRKPDSGNCAGDISDNDIKVDAIVSPASSGRLFSVTQLSATTNITIRIKNLDDNLSSSPINVSYSINGGTPVTATISSPAADITAGGTINYTFTTPADLSATGIYSIEAGAVKAGDPVMANNSKTVVVKQLTNTAFTNGDLPWTDNFEATAMQTITKDQMGLTGNDRYDFVNSTDSGQLRTFINTGIAYSGSKAVTLDRSTYDAAGNVDSLTGTFNFSSFTLADELRLDFRYKNHGQLSNPANRVWIRGSEFDPWIQVYDLFANQDSADGSFKLSSSIELNDSLSTHGQLFTNTFQVRWGQWGQYMTADNESGAGYTFDDIRIYRAVDDIQAERILTPLGRSCSFGASVPVKAVIRNTAPTVITAVPVMLYVDGGLIASEIITSIPANDTVQYLFTATANLSSPGDHIVEVRVDYATDNVPDNDTVRTTVKSLPYITTFPYLENFESGNGNWYTESFDKSTWEFGTPNSVKIKRAASGNNAWKTNLNGYYNDAEKSYLYSPCFDLSGMTNPTLSFSLALDIEDCGSGGLCDAGWMEYSNDGGLNWNKLGAVGQGTNWYNRNYAGNHVWSIQDYSRWHVATTTLPTTGNSNIRFRFVFNSDPGLNKDGMAIDDIHVYDNIYGIYTGSGPSPVSNQPTVNGTNWINFLSGGQLIASLNPNGLDMGSTDVQAYIFPGAVRTNSGQYYHNRNITIKPTTVMLSDSATVRFYFLDSETEALINATGCSSCYKPAMAYELGVSKYSDVDDFFEDGIVENSLVQSGWSYIDRTKIKMVPFDKGYYAEFKVRNFSEFWLNNGGFNGGQPLPLQLINFTAKKKNANDVLLEWTTMAESNVNRFEIEVARGNTDYQQQAFAKLGEVVSAGNSTQQQQYNFTDTESGKTGVRYYRLKIVDNDNTFRYSPVRPLLFDGKIKWEVYPNPSAGLFYLSIQGSRGEKIRLKVYDLAGKVVRQYSIEADGFIQKITIELQGNRFAPGLYMLEAISETGKQSFRLLKQ